MFKKIARCYTCCSEIPTLRLDDGSLAANNRRSSETDHPTLISVATSWNHRNTGGDIHSRFHPFRFSRYFFCDPKSWTLRKSLLQFCVRWHYESLFRSKGGTNRTCCPRFGNIGHICIWRVFLTSRKWVGAGPEQMRQKEHVLLTVWRCGGLRNAAYDALNWIFVIRFFAATITPSVTLRNFIHATLFFGCDIVFLGHVYFLFSYSGASSPVNWGISASRTTGFSFGAVLMWTSALFPFDGTLPIFRWAHCTWNNEKKKIGASQVHGESLPCLLTEELLSTCFERIFRSFSSCSLNWVGREPLWRGTGKNARSSVAAGGVGGPSTDLAVWAPASSFVSTSMWCRPSAPDR